MKKLIVATAAVIAMLAASAPSFAGDVAAPGTYPAAKATPQPKAAKRQTKLPVLDFMSTQTIVKSGEDASRDQKKAPVAPSGLAVNPWIVPSFL